MSTHLTITGTLPEGTRLGEFELVRVIREGAFGIVYLAWDHALERPVALKEYMPAHLAARADGFTVGPRSERHREAFEAGLRSFVDEARLLAGFDHPALVKVLRFWEAHGTACRVMPFHGAGTRLSAVRALPAPPDEAWLRRLLDPLCDALAMLHAAGCCHGNISPDNILLLPPDDRPLLLDFGAARRVIGGMTHSLTSVLEPGHAPIEQYAEVPGLRLGPATDVYALAAAVYWMITGRTPPPAVARMRDDTCEPLAVAAAGRYRPGFLRALDRALGVRPEQRTPDIAAFRQDLFAMPPAPMPPEAPAFAPVERAPALPAARTRPSRPARTARDAARPRPPATARQRAPVTLAASVAALSAAAALAWTLLPEGDPAFTPVEAVVAAPAGDGIETILLTAPTAAGEAASGPLTAPLSPPARPGRDTGSGPAVGPAPAPVADGAAAEAARRVECARLAEGGVFSGPGPDDGNRAQRLGCR